MYCLLRITKNIFGKTQLYIVLMGEVCLIRINKNFFRINQLYVVVM